MNWFDKLIQDALKDDYLNELIVKAENLYTINFFNIHSKDSFDLSEKEYNDLFVDGSCMLWFAILSFPGRGLF